ncbi:arginine--tRNA ligase [Psychrobacter sp. YP14]|jgi:arginyl-tRNA synthetase|uniref:Arginine--tRNA ligase n=2 Tax=Psychrobacter TaxID=497 RepID=SYR_PSYWF|nr:MULTISPECIES: arginine--tRNA ligase [Psychrobacter]A5WC58.1 RecName: Full=Arginine--tRNA ligase; AltName: Full=Arginyl-tRNA synthetase; Short=ArgRS [Psychrobacter sp. PRwf-1]AWT48331.1 arginine--tRNA ligase [Psychrobacter sp. YP14]MUG31534.1 arginine--tRNA ligase [Psychrobacter sanguinis]
MSQAQIDEIFALLDSAAKVLIDQGVLPADWQNNSQITRSKSPEHGDYASNIALTAAKAAKSNPRALAEQLTAALPANDSIAKLEIAGPGFINIFLNTDAKFAVLDAIFAKNQKYGLTDEFANKKIQVEFVSANPTSSLHVGHGRGAAFGMSVANLLEAVGYEVTREYYVNDAGRQMDILATSTYLRYLQLNGEQIHFPVGGYQGDYVTDIAQTIKTQQNDAYVHSYADISANAPEDEVSEVNDAGEKEVVSGDKNAHIDVIIANSKQALGDNYAVFLNAALSEILGDIKDDLNEFGVRFERWFSEKSIADEIEPVLAELDSKGHLYEKDGNIWFRSTDFGDEKDRVVRRANGLTTYFASDIAYHKNKFERGFDTVINVWGADHHGYIARVRAALTALGIDEKRLEVILVQFVALWRGEEKIQMSSRSGKFVTLRELREEVGNDAARFYYVARKPEVHIDFDLELAKSQSKDNAVYYIQYAHARVCSVLEKLAAKGFDVDDAQGSAQQHLLTADAESELIKLLAAYPATLKRAATGYDPHVLTNYLKDLASLFHAWYNDNRILPVSIIADETPSQEELDMMQARLRLSKAVRQVLANGLSLLGLSAPTSM